MMEGQLPPTKISELTRLIPHIFLPRKIPSSGSSTLLQDEGNLLRIIRDMVVETAQIADEQSMQDGNKCLSQTVTLFKTWWEAQEGEMMNPRKISKGISEAMEHGHPFALYIRDQNACLMFTATKDQLHKPDIAILSTIPASFSSKEIMSTTSNLFTTYPACSIHIPISDLLCSETLATQLRDCHTSRDYYTTSDPNMISQITALLMNEDSDVCSHFPKITKKVRDNVVMSEERWRSPFRRSGLWFAAKAVLQLSLVYGLGKNDGTFLYKLILLRLMAFIGANLPHDKADISLQIISKIAHRLCKLESHLEHNDVHHSLVRMYDRLRDETLKIVSTVQNQLETQWTEIVKVDAEQAKLDSLQGLDFQADIVHKFQSCQKYFQLENTKPLKLKGSPRPFKCAPRFQPAEMKTKPFPISHFKTTDEEELGIVLCDFERYVRTQLDEYASVSNCQDVRALLEMYVKKAKQYYKNDPVGGSEMVICSLKIVQVLDKLAINAQPLLAQHRSGIDMTIVKDLLLVKYDDMTLANELEMYFSKRDQTDLPSLIDEERISKNSFSAICASKNDIMRTKREKILAEENRRIEEKKAEVKRERKYVADLERQAEELSHSHHTSTMVAGAWHSSTGYPFYCTKCSLEQEAKNYKVNVYKRVLPPSEVEQYAIVFELEIPNEIACLRDALYFVRTEVCSTSMVYKKKRVNIDLWHSLCQSYIDKGTIKSTYQECQQHINLGSITQPLKRHNISFFDSDSFHPSFPDDIFITSSNFNCHFVVGKKCLRKPDKATVKDYCTFSIPQDSKYKSLEWALCDTVHSQNKVLAEQVNCPANMTLAEFIEYGSLRSGHRLQLRNIYRALQQDSLSFHDESVFILICQSLWQAGPQTSPPQVCRDSHLDLDDSNFAAVLLQLLHRVLRLHSDNWLRYYTVLNVVLLTVRTFSLSQDEEIKADALDILLECRQVVNSWVTKVEKFLKNMKEEPKRNVELRLVLIHINICSALTFWVDESDVPLVLNCTDDVVCWLNAIAGIKDNTILSAVTYSNLHNTLRNLLRCVRRVGVNLESHLHTLLRSNDSALNVFTESRCPISQGGNIHDWASCEGSEKQVYKSKIVCDDDKKITLRMDIIQGVFLVDGALIGYLPPAITNCADFQRVFSNTIFEVRRGEGGALITSYQNRTYSFLLSTRKHLIVTETDIENNEQQYQLVPHHVFKGDIPYLLQENYSHWWNRTKNTVSFRPKCFRNEGFVNEVSYILDLNSKQLVEVKTGKFVIDINSQAYLSLRRITDRLEHRYYVQALFSSRDRNTTIELPRMALQFQLDSEGQMNSREYPGMRVRPEQKFGTLVGLKQGFLMESINLSARSNPVLLMPHGDITVVPGCNHQAVSIEIEKLHSPSFFAFEVDERLCQLRAGQTHTGWLFLALLHASTASPMADPFTGLSGTESAFLLLQSAQCWSCQPLDAESTEILEAIARLSPCRNYSDHTQCVESIRWPDGVTSLAAHDGYQFIVKKLVDDSQRLAFLYKKTVPYLKIEYSNILAQRAYWRHLHNYTEQARIFANFDPHFQACSSTIETYSFNVNLDSKEIIDLRTMSHLGLTWSTALQQPLYPGTLKSFLLSKHGGLKGIQGIGFLDYRTISYLDVRYHWLDLYNFARNANSHECEWTRLLCTLAYKGEPLQQLQILHAVAVNSERFSRLDPPSESYYDEVHSEFDLASINGIFKEYATTVSDYSRRINQDRDAQINVYYAEYDREIKEQHENIVSSQVDQLTQIVKNQWPTNVFNSTQLNGYEYSEINVNNALSRLNSCLIKWYKNLQLKLFLEKVERELFQLNISEDFLKNKPISRFSSVILEKRHQYSFYDVNFHDLFRRKEINGTKTDDCRSTTELLAENKIATEAECIFRTGETNTCRVYQCVSAATSGTDADIPSFPWKSVKCCAISQAYMEDSLKSWEAYHRQSKGTVRIADDSSSLLEQMKKECINYSKYASTFWEEVRKRAYAMHQSFTMKILIATGLFPRVAPCTMLPLICNKDLDDELRNFIGATAVVWTLEQQAIRCIKYAEAGHSMESELQKELVTITCEQNWSPKERPEWLLLEIEMDLKIRPIQIKVANAMLSPDDNRHTVTQLNMGEGKTCVIVPMVVATLANETQLCRVTVLKSLFHTNKESLKLKIGGLINRRVYVFPCRRDIVIEEKEASIILQLYEECVAKQGVVITLPEYRLSFQLKGYEHCRNGKFEDASILLLVQDWLKKKARDVLDESDAILHVKYQLVYTVGDQLPIDGDNLRWAVAQSLLKLVPARLSDIMGRYGHSAAECEIATKNPERFPHCRILNVNYYKELCEMLVDDIFEGKLELPFPHLQEKDRDIIKVFLLCATIDKEDHEKASEIIALENNTRFRDITLILRGLLAYDVMLVVISKRWRVNYGVNPNGYRLMAVPFRAKDVAAERTEFGHPDVAILSTILSYYYSGLSDSQLDQCFDILYRQKDCEQEYVHWVSKVHGINPAIKSLNGVNLLDSEQRTKDLNPVFLRNMAVIDFWLDKVVFPKEVKQFDMKMLCTPWDLCPDDAVHPVTGFSGTNDTKLLLPMNIAQRDLPELQGTNGEVLYKLLLPENDEYRCLPPDTTNIVILTLLTKEKVTLLLDVGALMTGYSNRDVAWEWLNLEHKTTINAAIYFDESDKLVVIDKRGEPCLFELSPYRRRMNECVIYLDDFHTRGTDLRIPRGTKGCVTLGKGVTKDKLVQGCMRMRMLGNGHTLRFWASQEVNREICNLTGKQELLICTQDVLTWAMENTRLVTRDGFLYWVAAGFNYTTKKMAFRLFDCNKTSIAYQKLGERCSDKEVTTLSNLYGTVCQEESFPIIANSCLQVQLAQFEKCNLSADESHYFVDAKNLFLNIGGKIVAQCSKFIPDFKRSSRFFDEEQERELEHELEEERSIQKPPSANPAQSHFAPELLALIKDGQYIPGSWLIKLPFAFRHTKLWPVVQEDCWGQNMGTTRDFVNVVEIRDQEFCVDQFLRTPTWVVALLERKNTMLLLLSPHEVNELIPTFRTGRAKAVLHMYSARYQLDQDSLLQCPELSLPSSKKPVIYENLSALNANLSLFSGNLFFADEDEQDAYIKLVGFIPRPQSLEEQKAFENGWTSHGFVKPEFRKELQDITSQFQINPDPLIRGIIATRFENLPPVCHVLQVIAELKKPLSKEYKGAIPKQTRK